MGVGLAPGGGGVVVAGGGAPTLIYSPETRPVAERMASTPGQIRGTVALDISDISNFQAITAGTLIIGSETVAGIDLSAATTINEVIVALNAAIAAQGSLSDYIFRLLYIRQTFYGGIHRSGSDVEAVSGTVEPLFGLAAPASTVAHIARSPFVTLAEGAYSQLTFKVLGQSYSTLNWYFESDLAITGTGSVAHYLALNNSNGWLVQASVAKPGEIVPIGVARAYNVTYFTLSYHPVTRQLSWVANRVLPTQASWQPSIDALTVIGR